jgi:shikimate dehydrogenase
VLGAGGAARAVVVGLIEAAVGRLVVANRTTPRAEALVSDVQGADVEISVVGWQDQAFESACRSADLIVNTTPMGTAQTEIAGDSPLQARHLRPGVVAYDLVYNPPETPFLRLAADAGATPVSGLEMLIYQGAESIRLWTGREAPVEVMRKAARAALGC